MNKKMAIALICVLAVIAITALMLPFVISSDAVRAHLLDRAREVTGREMEFSGSPKVSFSPFLGIEINDVVFREQFGTEDTSPILSMPKLRGKLSLASALTGKVSLTEFQFVRPKFNLKIRSNGQSSWEFPQGKVWDVLQKAREIREATPTNETPQIQDVPNIPLGTFSFVDGVIEYENEISGQRESVTSFNGTLQWADTRSRWSFIGDGIWRGDAINLATSAERPVMLLAGGSSPVVINVKSEPLNLQLSGEANTFADLYVSGKLNATSPSLRRLVNLFGGDMLPGSSLGEFKAGGKLSGTISQLQLDEAGIELDGNNGSGNLRLAVTEENARRLTGTLAFNQISLIPYLTIFNSTAVNETRQVTDVTQVRNLEMDLRLSANTVTSDIFQLANFAGGLAYKNGMLALDIGNADLASGLMAGRLEVGYAENQYSVNTKLNLSDVDVASLGNLERLGVLKPLGKGDIELKLTSRGEDISKLTRNLTGDANLVLSNGSLQGLNLQSIRNAIDEGRTEGVSGAVGDDVAGTPFEELQISALINRGVAWVTKGKITSPGVTSKIVGKLDLYLGTLALRGQFVDDDADPESASSAAVESYFIGGTLNQPLYVSESPSAPPANSQDNPASGEQPAQPPSNQGNAGQGNTN